MSETSERIGNVAENAVLRLIARASMIILPGIIAWGFLDTRQGQTELHRMMWDVKLSVTELRKDMNVAQVAQSETSRLVERLQQQINATDHRQQQFYWENRKSNQ